MAIAESAGPQMHYVTGPRGCRQADGMCRDLSNRRHEVRRARRSHPGSERPYPPNPVKLLASYLRPPRGWRNVGPHPFHHEGRRIRLSSVRQNRRHPDTGIHRPGDVGNSRLYTRLDIGIGRHLLGFASPRRSSRCGSRTEEERERAMKFKLTFWRAVFIVIMGLGLYSAFIRFFHGLGAVSNMSDQFPWGLWIGFDLLCGVMLAAGGFCIVGAVYLFNVERLHSVVRPAVLTAFLGYVLFIVGLLFDLGRPWYIWHQLIYMNPHSVMFEVGICVMSYTTVLFFEFLPNVFERFHLHTPIRWIKKIYPVLIILGILLSTLHQSSLGSLYLIMPSKLHPFWYTPALPLLFFGSAIAVGLAMTIFESTQSAKAFGRHLELPVLVTLGGALLVALWVNALLRFEDYYRRDLLGQIFKTSYEAYFLWLELALTFVIPITMLSFKKVRLSPQWLYLASICSVLGFITNRLNIALIGFETYVGHHYMPKWTEFSITLMIVALGFALFGLAVKYLPIFPADQHTVEQRLRTETRPVVATAVLGHAGN